MWNKDSAFSFVMRHLYSKGYSPVLLSENKFGHRLIKTSNGNYYYIFKKDFFYSFNNIFKDYINEPNSIHGVAESINTEYIHFALRNKATLLFCHLGYENAIYTVDKEKLIPLLEMAGLYGITNNSTLMLLMYCEHHKLKRTQDRTNEYKVNDYSENTVLINEQTYSFPFKLLKKFNL